VETEVHYRVQKSRPTTPALSHMNSAHILQSSCPKIHPTPILLSARRFSKWSPSFLFCCLSSLVRLAHSSNMWRNWLRAGRPRGRSSSPGRVKNFLFSTSSRRALRPTQPAIEWVPEALSPAIKRSGREADHSPPTSAEVMKMWNYTATPPYTFMA
jgi:hypothetical protein